jgi:hypothetical protein
MVNVFNSRAALARFLAHTNANSLAAQLLFAQFNRTVSHYLLLVDKIIKPTYRPIESSDYSHSWLCISM